MSRRIRCPSCKAVLLFDEEDRGAKVCCPECEKWLVVPDAAFRTKGPLEPPRSRSSAEADEDDVRRPAKPARSRREEDRPARREENDRPARREESERPARRQESSRPARRGRFDDD